MILVRKRGKKFTFNKKGKLANIARIDSKTLCFHRQMNEKKSNIHPNVKFFR